jgi:hypothetical protein
MRGGGGLLVPLWKTDGASRDELPCTWPLRRVEFAPQVGIAPRTTEGDAMPTRDTVQLLPMTGQTGTVVPDYVARQFDSMNSTLVAVPQAVLTTASPQLTEPKPEPTA